MRYLSLLLLFSTFALAQKRPVTHEDIWLMKRTGARSSFPTTASRSTRAWPRSRFCSAVCRKS